MLVQFTPMVNTGASADAAYMNFLRCVRAIATAPAGTSSLTVNPFVNNTGTIDTTRNCITNIISSTEAGGWTESSRSNVTQTGAFTSNTAVTGYTHLLDLWAPTGKGVYPFMKFSITGFPNISTDTAGYRRWTNGAVSNGTSLFSSLGGGPVFTFGYSSTNDWTSTTYPPGLGVYTNPVHQGFSSGPATRTSWSFPSNGMFSTDNSGFIPTSPVFFNCIDTNRTYFIAVTAAYIIIWEQHISNSYLTGYANTFAHYQVTSSSNPVSYGNLYACGLREAQAWENAYSNNPTIYCMNITHSRNPVPSGNSSQSAPNFIWAPLLTINDSGVISTTLGNYWLDSFISVIGNPASYNSVTQTFGAANAADSLDNPIMLREIQPGVKTNQIYKPGVDTVTGVAVPAAYPIMIRRSASGSWTNGGAIRGLYKSLSMPIATMRNYFANGQTFNIFNSTTNTTDTYLPIVFNEDMWLVRVA